jgi:hypothetical protein
MREGLVRWIDVNRMCFSRNELDRSCFYPSGELAGGSIQLKGRAFERTAGEGSVLYRSQK